jgi:hypothetical protein
MDTIGAAYAACCKERFHLPVEEQVVKLEGRVGVSLPPDYRQYLLDFNGGFFTEPEIVALSVDVPLDNLTFMHGIDVGHAFAELGSDVHLFDDNAPTQVLPVGSTPMGNLLLLITHPEGYGCIVMKIAFSVVSYWRCTAAGRDNHSFRVQT